MHSLHHCTWQPWGGAFHLCPHRLYSLSAGFSLKTVGIHESFYLDFVSNTWITAQQACNLLSNPPGTAQGSCRAYLAHHGLKKDMERNLWARINPEAVDVSKLLCPLSVPLCAAVVHEWGELFYWPVEHHGYAWALLFHSRDRISVSSPHHVFKFQVFWDSLGWKGGGKTFQAQDKRERMNYGPVILWI